MTKPIPDKAEVAVEYPDKLYIGTLCGLLGSTHTLTSPASRSHSSAPATEDERKSVHMHFHYALFAEIVRDLAKTVAALPKSDISHRTELREAAEALASALQKGT
jgi:hypothetical protein